MPLFDKNVCVRQHWLRNSFMLVDFFLFIVLVLHNGRHRPMNRRAHHYTQINPVYRLQPEFLDATINSVVAATHKIYRLSTFTAIWCICQSLLETTTRAAICRDDGVVQSLRADSRVSVQVTSVRDGFTTSVSRRCTCPQWNEYENSGKLLYRSYPTNGSANLSFCPCVLRCNWMIRALHFQRANFLSKEMSNKIRLVPSMNVF